MAEENDSLYSKVLFLQRMVHRLNNALSKHQDRNMLENDQDESVVPADWLTDPTVLSPLIHEYDMQMSGLMMQVTKLTKENEEVKSNLQILTEENENLHEELSTVVKSRIEGVEIIDDKEMHENDMLASLQRQLELGQKEKDSAVEMNKESMKLLDSMRKAKLAESNDLLLKEKLLEELRSRNASLEDANLEMQMNIDALHNENQTLSFTASQQYEDIKRFKEDTTKLKEDLNQSYQREDRLKKLTEQLKIKMLQLEDERGALEHRDHINTTTKHKLENNLVETETKLSQALQRASEFEADAISLRSQLTQLERSKQDIDQKEFQYMLQIREGAQLLDDAVLSRDACALREKQLREDLRSSQRAMEELVEEVADRIQAEVEKTNSFFGEKIKRLLAEIESLVMETSNLRSDVERAKRNKRQVEAELETLQRKYKESCGEGRVAEFQRRALIAERAKDDMQITCESVEKQLKKATRDADDDRARWEAKQHTLEDRLVKLQREVEDNQHQNYGLLQALNQYKNDVQKYEEEARYSKLLAHKNFAMEKSKLEAANKQLTTKLRNANEKNGENTRQLHKMLADQQRLCARWKEESEHCSEKYEEKIKALTHRLAQNQRKCVELTNKLQAKEESFESLQGSDKENRGVRQQQRHHLALDSSRIGELESSNRHLRAQLHESDYQLMSATERLGELQSARNSLHFRDF